MNFLAFFFINYLSFLLFFSIKDTIWTNLFSIVILVKEIHLYKFPFLNIFSQTKLLEKKPLPSASFHVMGVYISSFFTYYD